VDERTVAVKHVEAGEVRLANNEPFVLVGGMNVLEEPPLVMEVAAAFQRTRRRMRRSTCSLPGKNGCSEAGMVLM